MKLVRPSSTSLTVLYSHRRRQTFNQPIMCISTSPCKLQVTNKLNWSSLVTSGSLFTPTTFSSLSLFTSVRSSSVPVLLSSVQQRRQIGRESALPVSPQLSLLSIKKFLRIKYLDYEETHPCLLVSIPKYLFQHDSNDRVTNWADIDDSLVSVFINKITGGFVIPELAASGNWLEFECLVNAWTKNKRLKRTDPGKVEIPRVNQLAPTLSHYARRVWESAVPIEQLDQTQFKDVLKNFRQIRRDFEMEDFAHFGVRVDSVNLDKLYFPVRYINGVLVGVRKVCVVDNQLEEVNIKGDEQDSSSGILPFIHNMDVVINSGSSQCVIVGSSLDSVVLTAKTNEQVIVLPDVFNLHPDLLPFLHQFSSITLWLGADLHETARAFARKIGDERCRIVSNEHPSPLSATRKKLNLQEIVSSAKVLHHKFITTFESLRHDVYLEFVQAEELEGVKWKRFDSLNGLLKGFRRGEMTIFTGRTGTGKTTFCSEYSIDLCMQGVNTLWGSFEVKNVRLVRMMMKQFSLVNLDENLDQFDKIAEKFQKLPMYFTTFHGSESVDRVLEAMNHAVYVHDIAHIIIDNLQFMIGSGSGTLDRFQQQDLCIEKFRKFATLHNCHVTLVIHPKKEWDPVLTVQSIFGGGKATQEADNVLLLQEENTPNAVVKRKYLEVAKNRYAGDLGHVPLAFSKPVLSLSKKVADQLRKTSRKKTLRLVDHEEGTGETVITEEVLIQPDD